MFGEEYLLEKRYFRIRKILEATNKRCECSNTISVAFIEKKRQYISTSTSKQHICQHSIPRLQKSYTILSRNEGIQHIMKPQSFPEIQRRKNVCIY